MATYGVVSVSVYYLESVAHITHVSTGHCYLMMDDLQQAYSAYQQALYHLRDPKVSFVAM
jgi:hypothetical protein